MRTCPICDEEARNKIFETPFTPPDGWTLPRLIVWYECKNCGMIYGDGDMTQAMFDEYYSDKYGYGLNSPLNVERLQRDAAMISVGEMDACIVDFGGAGDYGRSIIIDTLKGWGFTNAHCVGVGDTLPDNCDVIYASHVLEHIYDLPKTMSLIKNALATDGLFIADVPDATGLLNRWKMPILDFNTKHINHFTLRTLLELGYQWGFESILVNPYELEFAPCYQVHFKKMNTAHNSAKHVLANVLDRVNILREIKHPVNVWGMSDITWVLLSYVDLDVLNYIDNDPAMRGATFKGKLIVEQPDNDAPIVIMSQGQRARLIANIHRAGFTNEIIEV